MYFDIKPKTIKKDLFGVEYQLKLLESYIQDNSIRIIVIKGLRRTGKTSLLNVALNETKIKNIKIDVREAPFYDRKEFLIFLIRKIKDKTKDIFERIIEKIAGVKLGYEKFSIELFFSKERNVDLFFENLNSQLRKNKQFLVLALDEAQLLKNINFDYIIANIFDNYERIRFILTGSEIGILDKLLGKDDHAAPLFGRAYLEIELKRLREEDTLKFLEEGFKQVNKKIKFEEMREVIENLNGIIGWVTYYGWFRYKGLSHEKALERVKEEGKGIIKEEIEHFLQNRRAKANYLRVIKYLIKGHNNWSSLKQAFKKEGIKIFDSQLNLYLKELIDFGFVEKSFEQYFVTDPLLMLFK